MKMNWTKKLGIAALALTATISLTACTGQSAEDIMKTAQEKLNEIKSMSYEMKMDMDMAAEGETLKMTMTGNADCIVEPMAMQMDMTMDMGELGSMPMKMYAQDKDGSYVIYSGMDVGTGTMTWTSQTLGSMEDLMQYDAQASMDLYISSADSFKENGTESINGAETVRYDGIISQEAMNEVMTASGVMKQFSALGMDTSEITEMLANLGDLPISIWVEKESGLPVQYTMDMTTMMQTMMEKALASEAAEGEDATVTVNKVLISMTMSNFNGVEKIVIPEEALNAQPLQ